MNETIQALAAFFIQYQFQYNAAGGLFLTSGLTGLFLLMIIIWPNTWLKWLTLWFIFCLDAVMWRWCAGILWPDRFGAKESLLAGHVFIIAGISTFVLAAASWHRYLRDAWDA